MLLRLLSLSILFQLTVAQLTVAQNQSTLLIKRTLSKCKFVDAIDNRIGSIAVTGSQYNALIFAAQQGKVIFEANKSCFSEACIHGEHWDNCTGYDWADVAPFDTSVRFVSFWNEDPCDGGPYDTGTYNVRSMRSQCIVLFDSARSRYEFLNHPFAKQDFFFHSSDSLKAYRFLSNGLYGLTFSPCPARLPDSTGHLLKRDTLPQFFWSDNLNPHSLFFGANDTLWHTSNDGATWVKSMTGQINAIAAMTGDSVMVACSSDSASGGVYRSTNFGNTFVRLSSSPIASVSLDTSIGTVYCADPRMPGAVRRSDDTGRTFYTFNNAFTHAAMLAVSASHNGVMYAAATDGIYKITGSAVAAWLVAPMNRDTSVSVTPTLKWNRLPEASSYRVQIAADSLFQNIVQDTVGIADTMYVADTISILKTFYWRVKPALATSATPSWTDPWWFASLPALPSVVTHFEPHNDTVLQQTKVNFRWGHSVENVHQYWFEIADNDSFQNSFVDSVLTDTIASLYEPMTPHTYFWRVRAKNLAGWGPFSAVAHFAMLQRTDVDPLMPIADDVEIQVCPNPFSTETFIRISGAWPTLGDVHLGIFDLCGRRVADLTEKLRGGQQRIAFAVSGLPAGVYWCAFTSRSVTRSAFLLKLH